MMMQAAHGGDQGDDGEEGMLTNPFISSRASSISVSFLNDTYAMRRDSPVSISLITCTHTCMMAVRNYMCVCVCVCVCACVCT